MKLYNNKHLVAASLCMLFGLLLGSNCFAQQKTYTLQECLNEGLENNYSLKMVRNQQRVSDNNATVGNAGFLPSLSLSSSYRGNSQDSQTKLRDDNSIIEDKGIFNQTLDFRRKGSF